MPHVLFYSILSVIFVSVISLIGIITLAFKEERVKKIVIYLVSLSAGALFGDAFIHLLPEISENGFLLSSAFYILGGILLFFVLEKFVFWHHCHESREECIHSFVYMNLVGEGLHNFIDGVVIVASYIISIPVGLATTIAVLLHEIPQEIGDFGILVHGGFTRKKALIVNFLIALTAVLGALITFFISGFIENIQKFLIPIAIGGFIYIAGSDLIPELHKETDLKKSALQILAFALGIALMALLLLVG